MHVYEAQAFKLCQKERRKRQSEVLKKSSGNKILYNIQLTLDWMFKHTCIHKLLANAGANVSVTESTTNSFKKLRLKLLNVRARLIRYVLVIDMQVRSCYGKAMG